MAAAATNSSDEGEKWEFESDHEKVNIDDAVAEAEGNQTTTPRSGKNTRVSTMTAEDLNGALSARTERAKSTRGEAGVFVTDEDFQAMLRNVNRKEQDGNRMRKLVLLLIFLIVLLAAVTLGTSIAAVEMSKESHISNAKLVDVQGNSVATKSSDMDVCSDGTMVSSGGCADSSKEDGSSTAATNSSKLKTVQVKEKVSLASSLSDKFFMALDEVVVYSDKGHTLRLGIHGFARVPVLNSRCGNVVHLYTAWNGRLTIDSTDLSFDAATEAAFENAGFSLAVGGVSGRRLSSTHTVEGFYSAVQGVDEEGWTCQDVPLPTLPETYIQHLTIYRPCAVAGVTGTTMDPCDSLYGGVVPGTAVLSSALQLATMSKTERVAASLSVGVAVDQTMFLSFDIETMKSSSYEVQVSAFPNHPGMQKVNLFDRTSSSDATFQVISSLPDEGRFYCNSSGAGEATPQKKQVEAEQSGVNTTMHFEFIDTIEEDGKMLRHFRMMPAEAFLEWMGSDSATRPSDAYYEFWDDADTLTPVRLLNPDGSLVVFKAVQMGATDAEVQAKLSALGSSNWASMTTCTDAEKELVDVMAPSLDVAVPVMYSPMTDLNQEGFSFYAKLHLDEEIEDDSSNGWETLVAAAGSSSSSSLSSFAKYAVLSQDPMAMPDFCAEMCTQFFAPLKAEMQANPDAELCEASNLAPLLSCIVDVAAATNPLCAKTNFWRTVEGSCLASDSETDPSGRRLHEEEDDDFEQEEIDPAVQGGEEYRHRLKSVMERKKTGATQQSQMTTLKDGTKSVDISALDAEQRKQIAQVLGVKKLSSGRVVFNVSDSQMEQKGQEAWLEAQEGEHTTHSRRLMLDMVCKAPGVGVGCLFAIGYPWSCDPMGSDCKFSLAIKVQVGGPSNGALTVAGSGCIEEWAFGVPKPFSGSVCIDGGITVGTGRPCGLPFSLSGWVGITASVGLDLVLFSFSLASIRLEAGAQTVTYKYNCDSRRRRRRGWGGRRRGADETCSTACDVKVYAKATLQVLIGRIWAKAEYYVSHRDFDFILGADIYIWLLFTSWWETVAEVKIV